MKKISLLLVFLGFIGLQVIFAQTRDISGTVTSGEDGSTIPGASVVVKGTTLGTVTDMDGQFSLKVPATARVLMISFVGMVSAEVPITDASSYVIKLKSENIAVNEVVVTALGISREKKALGYSVQEVKSDELEKARGGVNNPINALTGKVAGLQITGASGNMGGSSKIVIRGVKSISGNNQPLFVVDGVPIEGTDFNTTDAARGAGGYDYGNLVQDINPDDIASISVLKGPNASALYGSRATNGVIMITTKKGVKSTGLGIAFNTSFGIEKVNKLPVMQNEYGGGYGFNDVTINGKDYLYPDYGTDESWGPKYDGTQVLSWYDVAKWEAGGKVGDPTTSPWVASPNDIKAFFETGHSFTNNVSISQASDNAAFRASYTNTVLTGYMPNSSMDKNILNISGTAKVNKVYELFTNITYMNQKAKGRAETGYGDNNVMQKFIQWGQRQLDMKQMEDLYQFPNGTQASWNRNDIDDATPAYSNNPYWTRYKNYQNDSRDRLYGNAGIKFNILSNLTAQYKASLDYFSDKQFERSAVYSQEESRYYEAHRTQFELNHEFLFSFKEKYNDFTLDANLGGNIMFQRFQRLTGTSVSGLVLPDFYNLSNSKSTAKAENYQREKAINSLFISGSLGYKSFAYIDATVRNDQSSTLPDGNNSYVYPSVTGSLVLSELYKADWLNFGKVRLGWAQVGSDTDPYRIMDTYSFYTSFSGNHAYLLPLTQNNTNLKPEITSSFEVGLELSFLNNRLGFDGTYYQSITKDQIIPLSISGTTGYTAKIINAGKLENKGIELMIKGVPLRNKEFEWTVTSTFSRNQNKVIELYEDVKYYRLTNAPFKVEVGAFVDEKYGVIMGTDYLYDDKGNKIVSDGLYAQTNGNVPLGSVYPDFIGGLMNTFKYKDLELSVLLDGQWGGKFFSTSYMWGMYSGMLDETAGLNELGVPLRDAAYDDDGNMLDGGVLVKGVNDDGTPNTTRMNAEDWAGSIYSGPAAQSVFKSDFIKLREISIGYTIPLKSKVVKGMKVSAYGRNLAIWGPDTRHFDPESATTNSGNVQGIEGGALPSVASYGINIGLKF